MTVLLTWQAGTRKVAEDIITCQFKQALYLHYASNCLNVVAVESLQDTLSCNMMGVLVRAAKYILWNPKQALEKAISDHVDG